MQDYYDVFVRNWWRSNPGWPNGLEPWPGRKTYLRKHVTHEDALEICEKYNATHTPGRLSRKAEFEDA